MRPTACRCASQEWPNAIAVDHTFSASLRDLSAPAPDATTTVAAPLVVLGGASPAPCPPVSLAGTGAVTVLGDAVIGGGCGSSAIAGDGSRLQPTGATSVILTEIADPLQALTGASATCGSGSNPTPLGVSPGPSSIVVHPQPVVLSAPVQFDPGRYVFCNGLTFQSGAVVQGTGVTLIVDGGAFDIDAGARVDLTAPATGDLANVLVWVRSSLDVDLELGPAASTLPRSGLRADLERHDRDRGRRGDRWTGRTRRHLRRCRHRAPGPTDLDDHDRSGHGAPPVSRALCTRP